MSPSLSMANCYFAKPDGMQMACNIVTSLSYVIDSKRALSFGEVPLRIYLCAQPQNACVRFCYPMRQNPQKCCLPCRLGTIIDFRVSGRPFAPALAKRSVKQTLHCLAARGEHTASKKLTQFALRSELRFIISRGDYS
jgi:hypothetical protein